MSERRFISVPVDLLKEAECWVDGALQCKSWHWDADQWDAADQCRTNLRELLAEPAPVPVEKPPRLSKRHRTVLLAMAEHDRNEQISPFKHLAVETGIELNLVRIAVRALARRGFAHLTRGLMTVDGEFCGGSGYGLTAAGRTLADKIGGDA